MSISVILLPVCHVLLGAEYHIIMTQEPAYPTIRGGLGSLFQKCSHREERALRFSAGSFVRPYTKFG